MFYSRRVGRSPQGRASVRGGYVDMPETTRILAAGKLSGKTGGWSVGLLNATTARTDASVIDSLGRRLTEPVEPLTNYSVARLLRDFRQGRSGLGVMATATHRRIRDEGLEFLPDAAYAAGANGWHRFGGSRYQLQGWLLGTQLQGSERAIARVQRSGAHLFVRPDAEHLTYDPTRPADWRPSRPG